MPHNPQFPIFRLNDHTQFLQGVPNCCRDCNNELNRWAIYYTPWESNKTKPSLKPNNNHRLCQPRCYSGRRGPPDLSVSEWVKTVIDN